VKLIDGAGHDALGVLAINAVEKSDPLPALPRQLTAQSIDVRMQFEYSPDCNANAGPFPITPSCQSSTTGCIVPPRIASSPNPENVQQTGGLKYSGTVSLQMTINTEGRPENITVLKSLGPGLDQKAIDAVRNWKFEPATKDGKPVAAQIVVEVDFHLYGKDEPNPDKP
jgi:TonB family protein